MALRGIVQERGGEKIRVVVATSEKPLGNVERVSPVRDWHRREQREGRGRQDTLDKGLLHGIDSGADVRDELPDPMHR
jgi:hypothetical protein